MKYYLNCEHCAHANEVTSEFLTFCESCKKKLGNNFREWSKHHADADFDRFKQEACLPEADLLKTMPEKKNDGLGHWVGISVTLAIIIGLGLLSLPTIFKMNVLSTLLKEEIRQSIPPGFMWKKYEVGSYGFSIESPFVIEKASVPIADQLGDLVQNSEAFNAISGNNDFFFGISIVEYMPAVGEGYLESAMQMSAEAMRKKQGISDFTLRQEMVDISGIEGMRQDGSYREGGHLIRFINAGFAEGQVMWQVFFGFAEDGRNMKATAEKMFESMEIEYNTIN